MTHQIRDGQRIYYAISVGDALDYRETGPTEEQREWVRRDRSKSTAPKRFGRQLINPRDFEDRPA